MTFPLASFFYSSYIVLPFDFSGILLWLETTRFCLFNPGLFNSMGNYYLSKLLSQHLGHILCIYLLCVCVLGEEMAVLS